MSSANCTILYSVLPITIPFKSEFDTIIIFDIFPAVKNRYSAIGSPCLQSFSISIASERNPYCCALAYMIFLKNLIHLIIELSKPKSTIDLYKNSHNVEC